MKAQDKETIYNLLKTAASGVCGYTAPAFAGAMPDFEDDAETATPNDAIQTADAAAPNTISAVAQKIAACQRCALAKTRTKVVPGEGVMKPLVVVVGEGPGYQEDQTGRPFVGLRASFWTKCLRPSGFRAKRIPLSQTS